MVVLGYTFDEDIVSVYHAFDDIEQALGIVETMIPTAVGKRQAGYKAALLSLEYYFIKNAIELCNEDKYMQGFLDGLNKLQQVCGTKTDPWNAGYREALNTFKKEAKILLKATVESFRADHKEEEKHRI